MTWKKPLTLISQDGTLKVNPKTALEIRKINKELIIVCMIGTLRTGKTTLLNRLVKYLIQGKSINVEKFPVSDESTPQTKGMMVCYIDHPTNKDKGFLIIDVEGIERKKDRTYDHKFLSLAILICSVFVFNKLGGVIDNALMTYLDFVKIAEYIRDKMEDDNLNPFPNLVIAMRDFIYSDITNDDEYMERELYRYCVHDIIENKILPEEDNLKEPVGNDEDDTKSVFEELILQSDATSYVKTLKDYFITRRCFLFPIPTILNNNVANAHSYENDSEALQREFKAKLESFGDYCCNHAPSKVFSTKAVDGDQFINCLFKYVEYVEKCSELGFHDIASVIIKKNNDKIITETVKSFQSGICDISMTLPPDIGELEKIAECVNMALNFYMKNAFPHHGDDDHYKRLKKEMCQVFPHYLNFCAAECEESLEHLFEVYEGDLDQVKEEYEKTQTHNLMKAIKLNEFLFDKVKQIQKEQSTVKISNYTKCEPTHLKQMIAQVDDLKQAVKTCIKKTLAIKAIDDFHSKTTNAQNKYDIEISKLEKRMKILKVLGDQNIEIKLIQLEIERLKNRRDKSVSEIWHAIKTFPHRAVLNIEWMFDKFTTFFDNFKSLDLKSKIDLTPFVKYE